MNKRYIDKNLVCIFIAAVCLMYPQLKSNSYFSTNYSDACAYTSWALQFIEALREGIAYPRWMPLNFWGYGSPTFLTYPPFAFYLIALLNVFYDSVIVAMNIAKFLAVFTGGIGVYLFISEFYCKRCALYGAIFYILFPHTVLQLYVFGAFAATISYLWFPYVLLYLYRYTQTKKLKSIVQASFCYALLIATHLVYAYLFTMVMILFVLFISIISSDRDRLFSIPYVLVGGWALSSYYLLPVLFERSHLQIHNFINNGFQYFNHFVYPHANSGSGWDSLFALLINQSVVLSLLVMLIALLHLKYNYLFVKDLQVINACFLIIAILSLFFVFGFSSFVWESLPFFKFIQFPTRWLSISTFAVSFLSATIFVMLENEVKSHLKINVYVLTVLLLFIFFDINIIKKAHFFTEADLLPAKPVNWTFEHLPSKVQVESIANYPDISQVSVNGDAKAELISWKSAERLIRITAKEEVVIRLRLFNFIGWTALVDDKVSNIFSEDKTGAILLELPKGDHLVRFCYKDTSVRYCGKLISLVSITVGLAYLIFEKFRFKIKAT